MLLRLRFSCFTIQVFSGFHLLKHSLFRLCCVTEWEGLLHKQQCLQHLTDCSSSAEPGRLVFLPVPFEWQLLTRVLSFVALNSAGHTFACAFSESCSDSSSAAVLEPSNIFLLSWICCLGKMHFTYFLFTFFSFLPSCSMQTHES